MKDANEFLLPEYSAQSRNLTIVLTLELLNAFPSTLSALPLLGLLRI
jgi:hypothetical protein